MARPKGREEAESYDYERFSRARMLLVGYGFFLHDIAISICSWTAMIDDCAECVLDLQWGRGDRGTGGS